MSDTVATLAKSASKSNAEDVLQAYFAQIKDNPLLEFEEELELSRRIMGGDPQARQKLVESNLRLVVKIARQYLSSGVGLLDLVQEGNLGLLHAVSKYDYRKKVRFSTYASWWIKQSISRAISNKRRSIRLPHRKEDILKKVQAAYNALSQKMMRTPNTEEIAEYLHLSREEVVDILSISEHLVSLDSQLSNDSGTMYDLYEDYSYAPEKELIDHSMNDSMRELLANLEDREQFVLINRYGLWGQEKLTLKEISCILDVSPETVRQIEMRSIRKLRQHAGSLQDFIDA
jgi:RNA polymerase primary sigma factor